MLQCTSPVKTELIQIKYMNNKINVHKITHANQTFLKIKFHNHNDEGFPDIAFSHLLKHILLMPVELFYDYFIAVRIS